MADTQKNSRKSMVMIYYWCTSLVLRFDLFFELLDPAESIETLEPDAFEWRLDRESSLGVPLCEPEPSRAESFLVEDRFLR